MTRSGTEDGVSTRSEGDGDEQLRDEWIRVNLGSAVVVAVLCYLFVLYPLERAGEVGSVVAILTTAAIWYLATLVIGRGLRSLDGVRGLETTEDES